MATATSKARCATCGKEKAVMKCGGCSQDYCFNHMTDHRQELSKQLDEIEVTRDVFRQTLTEQTSKPQKHALMQKIDQWERDSTAKIRQTAEEARQLLKKYTSDQLNDMEVQLNKLTNQLRESRQENDFIETDLQQWKEQLKKLQDELNKPSTVVIRHESIPLINKISVSQLTSSYMSSININTKWAQNGITVAGGNGAGSGLDRLNNPWGLFVDNDQTIYVADTCNNRIVEWKIGATNGRVAVGGNGQGNQTNQLYYPRNVIIDKETDSFIICDTNNKRVMRWSRQGSIHGEIFISDVDCYGLTMDNDRYLYVSDYSEHEVRRWKIGDTHGAVVAGGNGPGNRLDQLSNPTYIFLDQDHSVYVSDTTNHRIMKWTKGAKEGIVVAGSQGTGSGSNQLKYPYGVVVDQLGTVYVADCSNNRVVRWLKGATQGTVVAGGNGSGSGANQLSGPVGLSFDRQGNLHVVDQPNQRVQKFNIE